MNNRREPKNVNSLHQQKLGLQDRLALGITGAIGTMYAVYFFALFMAGWILWQSHLSHTPFDPYPFAFLLFLGNIVQLLLMPLIMVGQNLQGQHAQIRADEEFNTTTQTYHDLEKVMADLEVIKAQLAKKG